MPKNPKYPVVDQILDESDPSKRHPATPYVQDPINLPPEKRKPKDMTTDELIEGTVTEVGK